MKKTILQLVLLTIPFITFSQVTEQEKELRKDHTKDSIEGWKLTGAVELQFNQAHFSNWVAGGQNSLSATGRFNARALYQKKKDVWDNILDIGYGAMQKEGEEMLIKTNDKFDFISKYGRYAFKKWYYAGMVNFKTQFYEGRDYKTDTSKISNFMSPGLLTIALGMDYKPSSELSIFITPVSSRHTFVLDQTLADSGAYGVEPAVIENGKIITHGKKVRQEFGGYMRIQVKKEIFKNIELDSKLNLFSNYLKNPENVDVEWETLLKLKVNKVISTNISTHFIYDDDIKIGIDEDGDGVFEKKGPRLQFKEIFGIGLTYKF